MVVFRLYGYFRCVLRDEPNSWCAQWVSFDLPFKRNSKNPKKKHAFKS